MLTEKYIVLAYHKGDEILKVLIVSNNQINYVENIIHLASLDFLKVFGIPIKENLTKFQKYITCFTL